MGGLLLVAQRHVHRVGMAVRFHSRLMLELRRRLREAGVECSRSWGLVTVCVLSWLRLELPVPLSGRVHHWNGLHVVEHSDAQLLQLPLVGSVR